MNIVILLGLGGFTVINLVIYHKIFKVYYFNLGYGILKEIVAAGFVACIEIFLIFKVLVGLFSIVGGLFSFVASLIGILLPIAGIGIVVLVVKKIIDKRKENKQTDLNSTNETDTEKGEEHELLQSFICNSDTEKLESISKETEEENTEDIAFITEEWKPDNQTADECIKKEIFCTQCGNKIKR